MSTLRAKIKELKLEISALKGKEPEANVADVSKKNFKNSKSSVDTGSLEQSDSKMDDSKDNVKIISPAIASEVGDFVESCVDAFGCRSVQKHYIDEYAPITGFTHEQWIDNRRNKFSSIDSIEIEISDVDIVANDSDLNHLSVNFTQKYQSNTY